MFQDLSKTALFAGNFSTGFSTGSSHPAAFSLLFQTYDVLLTIDELEKKALALPDEAR